MMTNVLILAFGLFLAATFGKWYRSRNRKEAGYEKVPSQAVIKKTWDVAWDIIQKVSALLGILTLILKYAFGIEL